MLGKKGKILLFSLSLVFWPVFCLAATNALQLPIISFFKWVIGIAGFLAATVFAVGGVQYIISSGNPTAKKSARDQMLSSLLGLVLIFGSVLIMNTINPQITKLEVTGLASGPGIYYSNDSLADEKPAPMEEADSTFAQNSGYKTIKYTCLSNAGTPIIIWFYPKKYFQAEKPNLSDVVYKIVKCNNAENIQGESFKISFQNPGVYFFTKSGCGGFMSEAITSDQNSLSDPFKGKAKSMWIVNSQSENKKYGAILHENEIISSVGKCTGAIIDQDKNNYDPKKNCVDLDISAGSATIFSFQPVPENWWGQGPGADIRFFGKPWGWNAGTRSGFYSAAGPFNSKLKFFPEWAVKPQDIVFNYNGINESASYKAMCPSFDKCPGSISIAKSYILVLYTENPSSGYPYCQTFNSTINSAKETEIFATGKTIFRIEAIATGDACKYCQLLSI